MAHLVHYCPGTAGGSPAHLSPAEAQAQLARDTRTLEKLIEIDSVGAGPVRYPHVGGTCACCRQPQPLTRPQEA